MSIVNLLKNVWPEWEIVREIGAGSEGTVYMVKRSGSSDVLENYAAVKIQQLPAEFTQYGYRRETSNLIERMMEIREYPNKIFGTSYRHFMCADYLSQVLNHPNIVQIQDWVKVEENGKKYLLLRMELLLPLDEYLGYDTEKVGTDICSALSVLHKFGIFHLDVKPGNIFVSRDGTFKLGDFGSARNLYDIGKGNFIPGTLHYAAPEILSTRSLRSTEQDAARADIFSLGMVLFELLIWEQYGRGCHGPADEAHEREEWFQIQRYFANRDYDWYSDGRSTALDLAEPFSIQRSMDSNASMCLKDVVYKAICADPYHRYENADQMLEAIRTASQFRPSLQRTVLDSKKDISLEETFDAFIHNDVRSQLIIRYQSGAHRSFAGYPYVGEFSGLRMTYIGHEAPELVLINEAEILFKPMDGFIDLSIMSIFRDSTIPINFEIVAQYPQNQLFKWNLVSGTPDRHWEWFKRPDWT